MICVVVHEETADLAGGCSKEHQKEARQVSNELRGCTGTARNNIRPHIDTAAIAEAKRLQAAGHTPVLLRIEPWMHTTRTVADPAEHGEVFVLADGAEVAAALGAFERECGTQLSALSYLPLGCALAEALASDSGRARGMDDALRAAICTRVNKLAETAVLRSVAGGWQAVLPDAIVLDVAAGIDRAGLFYNACLAALRAVATDLVETAPVRLAEPRACTGTRVHGTIGLVADCCDRAGAFHSVEHALTAAARLLGGAVHVVVIPLSAVKERGAAALEGLAGIVVPGGFGDAFLDEKLLAVRYAREHALPFLGICLGFQLGLMEFARNVAGIAGATSEEFAPTACHPVISRAPRVPCRNTGRDMFLGAYPVEYRGAALQIYGSGARIQRFRHRYALNQAYVEVLESHGMRFCGKSSHGRVVMFCLESHPFFYGVQYHPELGGCGEVDPLFLHFIRAARNISE